MKKILLPVAIALGALTINAQESTTTSSVITKNPHAIGFRAGMTTPTYLGGDDQGYTKGMNIGFVGGFMYSYYFSNVFSFQPELLFMQGGYTWYQENKVPNTKDRQTVVYSYLQIPVLLKARFGSEAIKFTVHAGPYLGVQLGGNRHIKYEEVGQPTKDTYTKQVVSNSNLAPLDFGAAVGIGTNILCGPGVIMIDLRANIGLVDVNQHTGAPAGWKSSSNLIPSISVGYLLQLGKRN